MADILTLAATNEPTFDALASTSALRPRHTRTSSRLQTQQKQQQQQQSEPTAKQDDETKPYPVKRDYTPYPKILEPFFHRLHCFLFMWTIKFLGNVWMWYMDYFRPQAPGTAPDLVKRYPIRPKLHVDLFFPPNYEQEAAAAAATKSESRRLLPLFISIHGGGLCIGDSSFNNTFDRSWSRRTDMLVASLNYSKAPVSPFPHAAHDIAEVAGAVLADPTLPIDTSRVVIGGFSAGGLLCLSAVQLPPLKGKCHAAVAFYPCVDFSENPPTKFIRRLDTTRTFESLNIAGPTLDWGYVCPGQERKDPVLSPWYADSTDLPPAICIVGAQYDMFCREARDMIYQLAGHTEIAPGDGYKAGFEEGPYKWVFAHGMPHAFAEEVGRDPKDPAEKDRLEYCDGLYEDIHAWLKKNTL